MGWVRTSDQTARMVELRLAGRDAALLWFVGLHECAAIDDGAGGDGLLTGLVVKDAAHLYDLNAKRCAAKLVEVGLWHDATTVAACAECMERGGDRVTDGDWFVHGWWDRLLLAKGKTDPIVASREKRRKALNNDKALVERIRTRDRDLCRYCGVACDDSSGPNKKGRNARTLDHVDPWGDNTADNVVVACRTCNGRKRDRSPEEASMTLWAPGSTRDQIRAGTATAIRPHPAASGRQPATDPADPTESDPRPDPIRPEPDPDPASRGRRRETGRAGSRPDARPDLAGSGDGTGTGQAAPALAAAVVNGNAHHPGDGTAPGADAWEIR